MRGEKINMANYSDLENLQKLPDGKFINKISYVDDALKSFAYFDDPRYKNKKITSSKLRSIYSMLCDIIKDEKDTDSSCISDKCSAALRLLKVRIIYDMGRDESVKIFIENTNLIAYLVYVEKNKQSDDFKLYCKYFEALVAFHRYLNPKEN
jgi:CRISPR-associated protein Csm2